MESLLIVLIIGSNGMLGNTLFRYLSKSKQYFVYGTIRNQSSEISSQKTKNNIFHDIDIFDLERLEKLLLNLRPDVVLNCTGIVKQSDVIYQIDTTIYVNSYFPHKLNALCQKVSAKLIHFSTDCVFKGDGGSYSEKDKPDATDLYGLSKFMGEDKSCSNLTIRTSIIGHEINRNLGLLNWFLSQKTKVKGYVNAIFSGLPTIEIAQILDEYILPNYSLFGIYHIGGLPISKFELLNLIKTEYKSNTIIEPDYEIIIDRSLNFDKFSQQTGYKAKSWKKLIKDMRRFDRGLNGFF